MAHDVFITYSQHDKAVADAVCHRMEAAGIRCWIAPRDIAHGKTWDDAVVDAITVASLLVVIFSAAANASRSVLDEVATALDAGVTVIPFRIEDIRPTGALRLHLGRVHWLDALTPPLEAHIDRLIDSIKRNLPEAKKAEEEPGRQQEKEHRRHQPEEEERHQLHEEKQRLRDEEQRRRPKPAPAPQTMRVSDRRQSKKEQQPQERRPIFRRPTVVISALAAAAFELVVAWMLVPRRAPSPPVAPAKVISTPAPQEQTLASGSPSKPDIQGTVTAVASASLIKVGDRWS